MQNPELEAEIVANPDNEEAFVVYADWLQTRGDPRGELIAIERELAGDPGGERGCILRARRRGIFAAHGSELLGPLLDVRVPGLALEWHMGFVRAVHARRPLDGGEAIRVLRAVLSSPSCRFLRSLSLRPDDVEGPRPTFAPLVRELASAPRPALRSLRLSGLSVSGERRMPVWPTLGPLRELIANARNLTALTLCGIDIRIADLELPHLRALRLQLMRFSPRELDDLMHAGWASLDTLELWLGRLMVGDQELYKGLARLPRSLRHLALRNAERGDRLADYLVRSPLARRLRTLDLSMGTLTDSGARALAQGARELAHLERLDVSGNFIGSVGRKRLARLASARIGYQEPTSSDVAPLFPARFARDPMGARIDAARRCQRNSQYDEASDIYRDALAIARITGNRVRAGSILDEMHWVCYRAGRLDDAESALRTAIELDGSSPTGEHPIVRDHVRLATLLTSRGEFHRAIEILRRALDQAGFDTAEVGVELARAYMGLGRWSEALPLLQDAIEESGDESGDESGEPSAEQLELLGTAEQNLGLLAEAEATLRRSIAVQELDWNKPPAMLRLAWLLWRQERYDDASRLSREARDVARESGNRVSEARAMVCSGQLLLLRGRGSEAEPCFLDAARVLEEIGDRAGLGVSLTHLGVICRHLNRRDEAHAYLARGLALHRESGNRQWQEITTDELASLDNEGLSTEDLHRKILQLRRAMANQSR